MDELAWYAMESEDVIMVQFSHTHCRELYRGWYCVDLFAESVHKDADCVVSLGLW